MRVFRTSIYQKKISKLLTESETLSAEREILSDPEKWPVVAGTGGIRKPGLQEGIQAKVVVSESCIALEL